MFNIRRDVTSDRMASTAGVLEPSVLKHWITTAQTHTVTRRPQMTPVLSNALLTNDTWTKYIIIPGSLLAGGCLLFCSGYLLGSRKTKRIERSSPFEKCDAKGEIQISCFPAGKELSRVNSGTSLISSLSFDEVSERGSPGGNGGDSYRCALIVRKDCGLARGKVIIHCCRAFLAEFKKLYKQKDRDLKEWERDGMTVVVLKAESERELTSLKTRASAAGVVSHTFNEKQSDGSSLKTVMALGPSKSTLIRELTQHLNRL